MSGWLIFPHQQVKTLTQRRPQVGETSTLAVGTILGKLKPVDGSETPTGWNIYYCQKWIAD